MNKECQLYKLGGTHTEEVKHQRTDVETHAEWQGVAECVGATEKPTG